MAGPLLPLMVVYREVEGQDLSKVKLLLSVLKRLGGGLNL